MITLAPSSTPTTVRLWLAHDHSCFTMRIVPPTEPPPDAGVHRSESAPRADTPPRMRAAAVLPPRPPAPRSGSTLAEGVCRRRGAMGWRRWRRRRRRIARRAGSRGGRAAHRERCGHRRTPRRRRCCWPRAAAARMRRAAEAFDDVPHFVPHISSFCEGRHTHCRGASFFYCCAATMSRPSETRASWSAVPFFFLRADTGGGGLIFRSWRSMMCRPRCGISVPHMSFFFASRAASHATPTPASYAPPCAATMTSRCPTPIVKTRSAAVLMVHFSRRRMRRASATSPPPSASSTSCFTDIDQDFQLSTVGGDPYRLKGFQLRFVHTSEFKEVPSETADQHLLRLLSNYDCSAEINDVSLSMTGAVAAGGGPVPPLPPLRSNTTERISAFREQLTTSRPPRRGLLARLPRRLHPRRQRRQPEAGQPLQRAALVDPQRVGRRRRRDGLGDAADVRAAARRVERM